MNCPNCKTEITEDILECPFCGKSIEHAAEENQKQINYFTHYRVIVNSPGNRPDTLSLYNEITGLEEKQIKKKLENLPWTIADVVPNEKAQEIRILLEMHGAKVSVEGVDPWQKSDPLPETPETHTGKYSKRKVIIYSASALFIFSGILYLVFSLNSSGSGVFLQKIGSKLDERPIITRESKNQVDQVSGKAGSGVIPRIQKTENFILTVEGPNPFISDISFRLEVLKEMKLHIDIYDLELKKITTLVNRDFTPEIYRVRWEGNNDNSEKVLPGIYFLMISTENGKNFLKSIWLYN